MEKKEHILNEIKRIAAERVGKPPGEMIFERIAGIKKCEWYPHLWLRWGDALCEAGFAPNSFQERFNDEVILQSYISITQELGRFPVTGELRRKAREDDTFPAHTVFNRFGGKDKLISRLLSFCDGKAELDGIVALCNAHLKSTSSAASMTASKTNISVGFVYLMKSGRHYKIGRTNSLLRRSGELRIQIPVPPTTIHTIETDDPSGVEAYWHRRFSDKRGEGEWFELSPEDVAAFKRWKRLV